jgi:hypothetical protein
MLHQLAPQDPLATPWWAGVLIVAALIAHSLAVTQPDSHQKCESRVRPHGGLFTGSD